MTAKDASPQRLYLFELSRSAVPIGEGRTLSMVNVAYLIAMNDGNHILIDSGLPAGYAQPGMPPAQGTKSVLDFLAELGLAAADIDIVICTHFDVDHAGFHDAFTQAEFIVQRRHDTVARGGDPRYAPARSHWDAPGLRYRLVDGDCELFPGLRLIESSGHAPGHQSVLVRLPQSGPILLAIDAVVMQHLFTPDRRAWPTDDNEEELRASTRKLREIVAQEGVELVIFGHDGNQWQSLVKAPDYYA